MARYIDADKLIAHLQDEIRGCEPPFGSRANGKSIAYGTKLGLKSAISFVETLSTEDVAPKSELERLENVLNYYALQYGTVKDQQRVIDKAKSEVAREIFEEIENFIPRFKVGYFSYMSLTDGIAKLKKKYTEKGGAE